MRNYLDRVRSITDRLLRIKVTPLDGASNCAAQVVAVVDSEYSIKLVSCLTANVLKRKS